MNEAEIAEKFNAELDAVLNGAAPGPFSPDPGAMALAARFAAADFSAGSRVRESLRERLAAPGPFAALRALFLNNYARAAFAAAALAVALLPLLRRPAAPPAPAPLVTAALPQAPVAAPAPARPAPARPAAADDGGVFASLPMPALEPRRLEAFPIEPAGRLRIDVTEGREFRTDGASGIVWETGDAAYVLESRPAAPGELFEVRTL